MANLGQKNGIYFIRFRYQGAEYKRSLKTRDRVDAEAAKRIVEQTIHRLLVGLISVPTNVEIPKYILSGGTYTSTNDVERSSKEKTLTLQAVIQAYLENAALLIAPSYLASQSTHLQHLANFLGEKVSNPVDQIEVSELNRFLQHRLKIRQPVTVQKERITLIQFYKWVVRQGYLEISPAADLPVIKGGEDSSHFRTVEEIQRILQRGGLSKDETMQLWQCLYLTPQEIALLLQIVKSNAKDDRSLLLHTIAAYTGMRRGEILRLRWLDIDMDEKYLFARSRKQSRRRRETSRRIDLHPELEDILLRWHQLHDRGQFLLCDAESLKPLDVHHANRLFWQPMRDTEWCMDRKRNRFKVGFHTYRHSFASNLASQGIDQRIIDEFMGHNTDAMRRRYRHLFPSKRKAAIESLTFQQVED